MKIMESNQSFFTSRQYEQKRTSEKKLETWKNPPPPPIARAPATAMEPQPLTIETLPPELVSIKRILEIMTGKEINISTPKELKTQEIAFPDLETAPERLGWGMRYTELNTYLEAETTRFKTVGAVKTADGKTIDFSLELEMHRKFYTEERYQILAGDALQDPLVINFNGKGADLTDTRFSFDINADGEDESIPWLAQGSGFLALDSNKDGLVNDGSELFGPETGHGFSELARLDTDRNGWIDENDPGFDDLSIWSGPTWDTSFLTSLKAAGVGAISLSTAETAFTLKDESNITKGQIQRTGVYLSENGSVGTVQQLDLVV